MNLNKETFKDYKKYPERIIQFGEGNFLRAFVDWQIQKMNDEANFNSGVVAIQPRESGRVLPKLKAQDGLFTVCLQGIKDGEAVKEHSVINCISNCINPYEEFDKYLEVARSKELKFVISNTTEAGIAFDENDKYKSGCQKSYPGKLTALLYERFKFFKGEKGRGLIVIPCELIEKNGEELKAIIKKYAEVWKLEEEFLAWIETENTFCNTLVDRIVPGYPKDNIEEVTKEIGYEDKMVVVSEQYYLWVIEGPSFLKDELPVEEAGLNVKLVNDVTPYRERKVRILNGAHTALVPVAYLYGLDTVREAVEHEVVGEFIKEAIYEEIVPTLVSEDIPEEELVTYADSIIERFKNPFIHHYLMTIALNSMSKFETRDMPSILDYLKINGELPHRLVFSLAALIYFYKGKRGKETIELSDDDHILKFYKTIWENCDGTEEALEKLVQAVLAYKDIWKMDLNKVEGLKMAITKNIVNIEQLGIKKALEIHLNTVKVR
ncbi:tagaturonate reductase [Clostridium felsineum]|uniref:tagaturonate reductase n=1 Tax=Clostridium felsineum TaxID=36839 RepID=UPI00098CAA13|nr:tagaturonate reductase [Clostridium felsineum]URZ14901.1 Altronate oxidoreductase [Clostridium felsineum DSM 794]